MLTSIHTFDPAAGCDAATFQPCSDKALSNLKVYVDSFRSVYSINSGIASNAAVAVGRYPEDSYQGGNVSLPAHCDCSVLSADKRALQPWYLSVSAVAEQLYDALVVWNKTGSLQVTSTSLAFFRQFDSSVATGTYASSSATYTTLTTGVKNFADGFLAINAKYTPSNGGLAEQFSRSNGAPLSAVDLTWSYAAALTSFAGRNGKTYAGWGADKVTVPTSCSSGPGGAGVPVTFNVQATTTFGGDYPLVPF